MFGSNDGITWHSLGDMRASGADQALRKAQESQPYRLYAACPERNWKAGAPEVVQRPPVVRWKPLPKSQLTVDDVIEEAEKEGVITERAER